jgi:hypothetical protein
VIRVEERPKDQQEHLEDPSVAEGLAEPGHKDGEHRAGEREHVETSEVEAGIPEGLEGIDASEEEP